ncbi:MAG: GNAT family N-acetyltransferase [Bacteroidales bacterium]|nr:GNAT family N-acetyltransferase [Bacteroidales bacterium]
MKNTKTVVRKRKNSNEDFKLSHRMEIIVNQNICLKNNFAGLIGLKEIDNLNHRTELGYWLLPDFEGVEIEGEYLNGKYVNLNLYSILKTNS